MVPAPVCFRNSFCGGSSYSGPITEEKKSWNPNVCIAVVGVGIIGESLLTEFGRSFEAIGYDISTRRVQQLLPVFQQWNNVHLTTDETHLSKATHFLISVPTTLRPDRSVNLDHVVSAVQTVLGHARPGSSIIIESSVSVGTTRQVLGPYKHVFNCGMSPERMDPGRAWPIVERVPKVISALTPSALQPINYIYSQVFEHVVPVSSPEVAEMTKLYENCYRMVNIAYANEISDACRKQGIDPVEMINAAATKPYGFQAFYPGLGVGGRCIPVNPFYLFANNKNLPILERATKLMCGRPHKLASNFHRRCLSTGSFPRVRVMPCVLVVGVGFKPGQSEVSNSPALTFARHLKDNGCTRLAFHDPLVAQSAIPWMEKLDDSAWNADYLDAEFDGIALCIRQCGVDFHVTRGLSNTFVRCFF